MPVIPAVCNNCGATFSSGIFVDNVINLTLKNNTAGPCPICGSRGRIKDGVFNVLDGVIKELQSLNYTKEELQELSNVVNKIKNKTDDPEKIEKTLDNANPKFSSVLELLPQNREEKKSDIKFLMSILIPALITILTIFINSSTNSSINYNVNINQIINMGYENTNNTAPKINQGFYREAEFKKIGTAVGAKANKKLPIRVNKAGRNQECPCGSGIKFKKCHGK